MRIFTKIVWDIESGTILESCTEMYSGFVAWAKGASDQQKDLANQQTAMYKTLTDNYKTQFANQSKLLDIIGKAAMPILQAGPNQYGYNPAEDTALRTQATEGTAAQYKKVNQAVGENLAAAGGGDAFLPSGVNAQLKSQVATAAANQESQQQLGITTSGYELGRQNFYNAANIEAGNAAQYNPTGFAGQATGAGKDAFDSATTIQELDAAASPWGAIGGALGGIGGTIIGGMVGGPAGAQLGGSLGKGLGGSVGGAFG